MERIFDGPGEMRERCRIHDWAATPLGRVESWPQSLRTIASTVLAMGFPAIVLWGPQSVQLYNDAYIPFLGVKHPAALGMPSRLCWPEVWHLVEPVIARVLDGETVTLADQHYPLLRMGPGLPPDDVYITLSSLPLRDEAGAVGGVLVTCIDTTAAAFQREMAAHIARYNAQLSANAEEREHAHAALETRVAERTAELARANAALVAEIAERTRSEEGRNALRLQLALAEEAERRRLSRELHDQLGQHLTALTLGLDALSAAMPADSPTHARLVPLRDLVAILMRDARSLAVALRPPELDDVGLDSAVASYVSQWSARYEVATEIAISGLGEHDVPDATASALYRVLQEALTNVARHAAARQVSVILDRANGAVRLIVEDDGRGFDVESTTPHSVRERRLGLAGMRERAALAGGTLTVESAPGSGTTIYVRIPLERGGEPAMPAASPAAHAETRSSP
jgi:signal transduction histidine kinase